VVQDRAIGVSGQKLFAPGLARGHNNIKINPVFRGMVRQVKRRAFNQRKNL